MSKETMLCLGEKVRYGVKGGGTVREVKLYGSRPAFRPQGPRALLFLSTRTFFKIMQWGSLTTARLHEGRRSLCNGKLWCFTLRRLNSVTTTSIRVEYRCKFLSSLVVEQQVSHITRLSFTRHDQHQRSIRILGTTPYSAEQAF